MAEPMQIRLSRTKDGEGVFLTTNGRELYFSASDWKELSAMLSDFNLIGCRQLQNYPELPTRTPLHANTPRPSTKANLDDLA